METTTKMVSTSKLFDAYSGASLADTTQTILSALSKPQLGRYRNALVKVTSGRNLNRKDLLLFDAIDELTYERHGMCLKDSHVTSARLKASKKWRIEFIDRDGLLDHMNAMDSRESITDKRDSFHESLGAFFKQRMGDGCEFKLRKIIKKLDSNDDFNLNDLIYLSDLEGVAQQELDWTIINEEMKAAIEKASNKLGIYFKNLQKVVAH